MADYHFTTNWQFEAPLESVWYEIKTVKNWPTWWPYVQKVELLKEGGVDDVGSIRRLTWKTALPYTLTFDSEVIALEKFKRIEARAFGELEGKGIWTFTLTDDTTFVRYDWIVQTHKAWMNLLAPIARPVFSWNHSKVMKGGYVGLCNRLY